MTAAARSEQSRRDLTKRSPVGYAVAQLAKAASLIFAVSVITFFLAKVAGFNPVDAYFGSELTASPEQRAALADRLDELTAELGLHATSQLAIRVSDLSLIADAMARLRENPPTSLLHAPVSYRDLAEGTSGLPPTDAVELSGDEVHVVVRPSGTEPKLKCYLEVRLTPERSRAGTAARLAAEIRMMALRGQIQSVLGLG